jgi:hypothetical protein
MLLEEKDFNTKDFLNYLLSVLAFLMSLAAFIFTVIIQKKERKRNIRQTLTTALNDVARVNVDVAKLLNEKEETPGTLATRKNYNTQLGTLIADADFLIHENMKIVTDIDCSLMASTYYDLGVLQKAEYYWKQCMSRGHTPLQKLIATRDYAAFLYNCNRQEEGRKQFIRAMMFKPGGNDHNWRVIADSYLLWAKAEQSLGNEKEFERLMQLAYNSCDKIRHLDKYNSLKKQLDESKRPVRHKKAN